MRVEQKNLTEPYIRADIYTIMAAYQDIGYQPPFMSFRWIEANNAWKRLMERMAGIDRDIDEITKEEGDSEFGKIALRSLHQEKAYCLQRFREESRLMSESLLDSVVTTREEHATIPNMSASERARFLSGWVIVKEGYEK